MAIITDSYTFKQFSGKFIHQEHIGLHTDNPGIVDIYENGSIYTHYNDKTEKDDLSYYLRGHIETVKVGIGQTIKQVVID